MKKLKILEKSFVTLSVLLLVAMFVSAAHASEVTGTLSGGNSNNGSISGTVVGGGGGNTVVPALGGGGGVPLTQNTSNQGASSTNNPSSGQLFFATGNNATSASQPRSVATNVPKSSTRSVNTSKPATTVTPGTTDNTTVEQSGELLVPDEGFIAQAEPTDNYTTNTDNTTTPEVAAVGNSGFSGTTWFWIILLALLLIGTIIYSYSRPKTIRRP
jgi:hypothetical protein